MGKYRGFAASSGALEYRTTPTLVGGLVWFTSATAKSFAVSNPAGVTEEDPSKTKIISAMDSHSKPKWTIGSTDGSVVPQFHSSFSGSSGATVGLVKSDGPEVASASDGPEVGSASDGPEVASAGDGPEVASASADAVGSSVATFSSSSPGGVGQAGRSHAAVSLVAAQTAPSSSTARVRVCVASPQSASQSAQSLQVASSHSASQGCMPQRTTFSTCDSFTAQWPPFRAGSMVRVLFFQPPPQVFVQGV
jgi:hypothetical protein